MEEQRRKEVEEELKRRHQEAEPKLTEWMDFDRRALECHSGFVKDALECKRGIYACIVVEGETLVIKIGFIFQNDTYVDGTPLPKEKDRNLFNRLQENLREANLVCSSFCFLHTPGEEKEDVIMAETLAKFALFTQKATDKDISRFTGKSERFEISTELCYDIMNKLLRFIKTRHTEIMIGDKLTKVTGGDFKNNELYLYYLHKMSWHVHVNADCCFSIAGRKEMRNQEKNTRWQSFIQNINEPCPCITQKISQRRSSRSSSEAEKKQHNGTLKKNKAHKAARKSSNPSGTRPNPPNPGATAALQEALASAQDNDGVIETKCLNKALSFGFSKAFLDAKVEEQEELNVKPAAKKLRTEQ